MGIRGRNVSFLPLSLSPSPLSPSLMRRLSSFFSPALPLFLSGLSPSLPSPLFLSHPLSSPLSPYLLLLRRKERRRERRRRRRRRRRKVYSKLTQ